MKRGCDQSQVNRLADVLETGANRKAAEFIARDRHRKYLAGKAPIPEIADQSVDNGTAP
jgi:hypothetical protein